MTDHNLISIHAPANGATVTQHIHLISNVISIHAPANGATYTSPSLAKYITISIHAPANGATVTQHIHLISNVISIHAPANGATLSYTFLPVLDLFQSTLRRTERPCLQTPLFSFVYFNPRSGERSDLLLSDCQLDYGYFNPRSGERSDH